MNSHDAADIFESLASPLRLEIYRLLVKHEPEGVNAGDIARSLALPANNASFHLKALTHAGLIEVEAQGRFQRYRANIAIMQRVITYLSAECCNGNPTQCADIQPTSGGKKSIRIASLPT